ncbi:C4b-binding protein beta chain-like isoform X2 [Carcharodon carcharias]|uniref:C4b-binding protein beta chain-like isoform X2 n=1 Tax=Carcharodon carcharias TaxID=13397 RepID=UPI001B7F6D52|nr:C4b-binding protein beta chain-like isoform X2 [Carcharodon carcharias]
MLHRLCFPGREFNDYYLCEKNLTWTPLQATCEPRGCGNPGEIMNGYETSDTTLGNKVTFHCDEGYKLVGSDYQICTYTGWSGVVPTYKRTLKSKASYHPYWPLLHFPGPTWGMLSAWQSVQSGLEQVPSGYLIGICKLVPFWS